MQQEGGSSSEEGMEGLGPEERRQKRVRQGAIASTTGYIAPMNETNLEGEVQIQAEVMDVQEMEDMDLLQLAIYLDAHMVDGRSDGLKGEGMSRTDEEEHVSFMQRSAHVDFATALQELLENLEKMPKMKAARVAAFLQEMLRDQQRMAPHLRNSVLMSRAERLRALLTAFQEEDNHIATVVPEKMAAYGSVPGGVRGGE